MQFISSGSNINQPSRFPFKKSIVINAILLVTVRPVLKNWTRLSFSGRQYIREHNREIRFCSCDLDLDPM